MNSPSTQPALLTTLHPRLLLALCLLLGSEVLAWNNPPARPALEWLLLLPGYFALSALLLDFISRYRVRDLFGALVVTGVYTLTAALVLNPAPTLDDLPRSLVTRIMGAHALLAAEMLGLFLYLTGGTFKPRYLFIGAVIVGLAWGIWVKNWPPDEGFGMVELPTLLAYGVAALAGLAALVYGPLWNPHLPAFTGEGAKNSVAMGGADSKNAVPTADTVLSRRGWLLVAVTLGGLVAVRLLRAEIPSGALVVVGLLVLCWAILWFRGRKKGASLLDGRVPVNPPPVTRFLLTGALFLGVAVFGYNLPAFQLGSVTPYSFIGLGFTAYGLAWLPTVSLVLGIQGYLRQLATRQQ